MFSPPLSFTPVVILILYVVFLDKFDEVVAVNVLKSLDTVGEADI